MQIDKDINMDNFILIAIAGVKFSKAPVLFISDNFVSKIVKIAPKIKVIGSSFRTYEKLNRVKDPSDSVEAIALDIIGSRNNKEEKVRALNKDNKSFLLILL
tara:strand:+ start:23 stop:328 length:306 start_codon:yes stop_codon:yes gene_type:complete